MLDQSVHIRPEANANVVLSGHGGKAVVTCRALGVFISSLTLSQTGGDKSLRGR